MSTHAMPALIGPSQCHSQKDSERENTWTYNTSVGRVVVVLVMVLFGGQGDPRSRGGGSSRYWQGRGGLKDRDGCRGGGGNVGTTPLEGRSGLGGGLSAGGSGDIAARARNIGHFSCCCLGVGQFAMLIFQVFRVFIHTL